MRNSEFEQEYSRFLDDMAYQDMGKMLYELTRSAFLAGWEAGKNSQAAEELSEDGEKNE